MFTGINYLAVLVSAIVFFILGGLWYAALFSKPWQEGLNFSPEEKAEAEKNFPKALASHFISGLISSFVLANIVRYMEASNFIEGIVCGLWIWLGFAFTIHLISLMFEKRPLKVFLINNGFYLIAFTIMGGILAVWR